MAECKGRSLLAWWSWPRDGWGGGIRTPRSRDSYPIDASSACQRNSTVRFPLFVTGVWPNVAPPWPRGPPAPPVRLTEVAPQATEPPRGLAPGRQGFPMHPQFTQRPPAPGTAADVHLLIGNGRAPVVVAEITPVLDRDVLYLRLQVDDVPRFGTRHG